MKFKLFALLGVAVAINSGHASDDFWNSNCNSARAFTNSYAPSWTNSNTSTWQAPACPKIIEVNYSWGDLNHLEVSTDKWSNVETMYLGNNNFSEIPKGISTLSKLKEIYLESNKLESLSSEDLKQLRFTKKAMLHNNNINSIDSSISTLRNLEELSLAYNQLTTLPADFIYLRNTIKTLNLIGNPLKENGSIKDGYFVTLGWKQLQKFFGDKLLFNPSAKKPVHLIKNTEKDLGQVIKSESVI